MSKSPSSPIATAFLDSLREEFPEEFHTENTVESRRRKFYRDNTDELLRLETVNEDTRSLSGTFDYLDIVDPYERKETIK